MTTIAMTLPVMRHSGIVLPRRDLVTAVGETVTIQISVKASDDPTAAAVDLSPAGTFVRLLVWQPTTTLAYGWPYLPTQAAWAVDATILAGTGGRADVSVPAVARAGWPTRMAWMIELTMGADVTSLASGVINAGSGGLLPDTYPQVIP